LIVTRIIAAFALVLTLSPWLLVAEASSQDIIDLFQRQRFRIEAERLIREKGARVQPAQATMLPTRADSVRAVLARFSPHSESPMDAYEAPVVIDQVLVVRRFQRGWFEEQYGATKWSFIGNHRLEEIDTLRTNDLRSRLEAHFGAPSQTLVERERLRPRIDEAVQFEYWFVVNDSIPVIVSDVGGPTDRGLVFQTDDRFASQLPALRRALLGVLVDQPARAPYVDYFYHVLSDTWFRTGYDGRRFFMDRIRPPDLTRGRPLLEGQ
jgi:hypothetical protein